METLVGLFIALGIAALFFLAMQVSDISAWGEEKGYVVTASFDNIGGLKVRAPVTMAGVRIGRVSAIGVDQQSFEAVVSLTIDPRYDNLPEDTSASILTAGLLGEQYIGLEPGGSEDNLQAGDRIKLTQGALVLEKIIGQFLFSAAQGEKEANQPELEQP